MAAPRIISPERRMVYGIYISPEFESVLHPPKTVNQLMKEATKLQNNSAGATSMASIYRLPDSKKYIIRKTKSSPMTGMRLKNEIDIYRILLSDPAYKQFISNLVYADAHLAASIPFSYFIFEYEDGEVLDKYIKNNMGTKSINEVMAIYNHLQSAVDYLASKNIVHKDIKPENIYFSTQRNIPLLFDFDASCMGQSCKSSEFSGSPKYATPGSMTLRGQDGFSISKVITIYKYSPIYDKYSLAVLLEDDLSKLVKPEDKKRIKEIAEEEKLKYLAQNSELQNKKGGYMKRNTTKKSKNRADQMLRENRARIGGMRIGLMNPTYGGKSVSEGLKGKSGGGCPCAAVPKLPTPLQGGYRATKRNLKYLKLWKQGKSIGFTMRSSLKAKGLIPRANGTKKVSPKYRK
jgi:serine/threonine protein kinase